MLQALILAAGFSSRMGLCKASLPWVEGQSLLTYQIEQFQLAGFSTMVVLGAHNVDRLQPLVQGNPWVVNPDPGRGKVSSIVLGIAAMPVAFTAVAISAVDQPRSADIYRTLVQAHHQAKLLITAPTYRGHIGHPLLFSGQMRSRLLAISEETLGLRQLIQELQPSMHTIEIPTPQIMRDFNTPQDYNHGFHQELGLNQ